MHACNQVLRALLIFLHPFCAAFHVPPLGFFSVGQGGMSHPDSGHIVHIYGVRQQLLLILEDDFVCCASDLEFVRI